VLTIAIPTYRREGILIDTLRHVRSASEPVVDVIVLDQTFEHTDAVTQSLQEMDVAGAIRWLRLSDPSITRAMNCGLVEARHDIVLFLDDDIVPEPGLIEAHLDAHLETGAALVAGRVIQPWQEAVDFSTDENFHFASTRPAWVTEFMGGNFSLRRDVALRLGGFDEHFVGVAYNFEAEFAHRLRQAGHKIYFAPKAIIHHLKAPSGGTRVFGEHLTTMRPDHAVGAYYFMLRTWCGWRSLRSFLWRPLRAIATRHHLRRPWWVPLTLIGELRGMALAISLAARGPNLIDAPSSRVDRE
jgi:GT2 family glycosyltransferase